MPKIKLYESEAWLKQKYYIEKLSIADIAKLCNVSDRSIRTYLKRYGLIK